MRNFLGRMQIQCGVVVAVILGLSGALFFGISKSDARELPSVHQAKSCGAFGGGGELPSPFDTANHRVELADGEAYLLVGRVVMMQNPGFSTDNRMFPYFRVDLNEHPWLATEKRISQPYYPLEGAVEDWKKYVGAGKVKLPCTAHGVVKFFGSEVVYTMQLQASSDIPVEPMND